MLAEGDLGVLDNIKKCIDWKYTQSPNMYERYNEYKRGERSMSG